MTGFAKVCNGSFWLPSPELDTETLHDYQQWEWFRETVDRSRMRTYHRAWLEIVQNFSHQHLTYLQDKLATITGVVAVVANLSGMTYMAGLWKAFLGLELLWQIDLDVGNSLEAKARGKEFQTVAPSWSWASVPGTVKWGEIPGEIRSEILIEFINTKGFDNVINSVGWVTVRGKVQRITSYLSDSCINNLDLYSFL